LEHSNPLKRRFSTGSKKRCFFELVPKMYFWNQRQKKGISVVAPKKPGFLGATKKKK